MDNILLFLPSQDQHNQSTFVPLTLLDYVLFFGLIRKYKGLETLINSMKYNHNFKLLIVGEFYDNKNKYLNLIEELNLKERVEIVDKFVGNEEIRNYFVKSKAVVDARFSNLRRYVSIVRK